MGNSQFCQSITCPPDYSMNSLEIVTFVTGVLSMLSCIIIISTYCLWPYLQTTTRKLLVYLSIADYTVAACNAVGAICHNEIVCSSYGQTPGPGRDGIIQSAIGTYASSCSYFWTMFLAVYLYVMIVKSNSVLAERLLPVFHVVSWGLPAIEVGLAAWKGKLGCNGKAEITGGWCWIVLNSQDLRTDDVMWMLFTGKLWELIAYFVIFILYFRIKYHFRRERGKPGQLITRASYASAQYIDRKLTFIPIAFILLRMWGMIRFILYVADPMLIQCQGDIAQTGWLVYMQAIGDTAQGIVNCVLFCLLTNRVRKQWVDSCCGFCRTCCIQESSAGWTRGGSGRFNSSGRSGSSSPTPPLFDVE